MAQEIFTLNAKVRENNLSLMSLAILSLFFWINVTVIAAFQASNFDDDRRTPLSEELLDPSKEWREYKQPKQSWRTEDPLTREKKKRGRFEDKRFKPKYYDPEKEGGNWDPYTRDGKEFNSKPATLFRFQF